MPKVLIYCRELAGHRQIYCHVIARYFLANRYKVVLAVGCLPSHAGSNQQSFSPLIESLRSDPDVEVEYLKTEENNQGHDPTVELYIIQQLQQRHDANLLFFPDGDSLRLILVNVVNRQAIALRGGCAAIFLRLSSLDLVQWFPLRKESFISVLRKINACQRDFIFFKHALSKQIPGIHAFVLDPRFVNVMHQANIQWLPDISTSFDQGNNGAADQGKIYDSLHKFLLKNHDKEPILYFGTNQQRRGYEWLLKLVHDHPDTVFLHCGRLDETRTLNEAVSGMRQQLDKEERLFETKVFITDKKIVDTAFQVSRYVLLPYASHYGSSGVMIQAASYGKAVLVPRGGLMAFWVNRFRFGRVFAEGSYSDFQREFNLLRKDRNSYTTAAYRYAGAFSQQAVYSALDIGLHRFTDIIRPNS